jgi:hypothetical protein
MLLKILALVPAIISAISGLISSIRGGRRRREECEHEHAPVEEAADVVSMTPEQLEALRRSVSDGK